MTETAMKTKRIDELVALLDEERDALVAGDYDRAEALLARKETLSAAVEKGFAAADPADIAPELKPRLVTLQAALFRNENLLRAARLGLEQAKVRVQRIKSKKAEVGVYESSGERPQLETPSYAQGRRV